GMVDHQPHLFVQLAHGRLFKALARLHPAAGRGPAALSGRGARQEGEAEEQDPPVAVDDEEPGGRAAAVCGHRPDQGFTAAVTITSTRYSGEASFASPVARAGVWPGTTHLSQTEFISAKSAMSASQMIA